MKKRLNRSSYMYRRGVISFPPPLSGLLVAMALFSLYYISPTLPGVARITLEQAGELPRFSMVGSQAIRMSAEALPFFAETAAVPSQVTDTVESEVEQVANLLEDKKNLTQESFALGLARNQAAALSLVDIFTINTQAIVSGIKNSTQAVATAVRATPYALSDRMVAAVTTTAESIAEPTASWWDTVGEALRVWSDGLINGWGNLGQMIGDYRNIITSNWRKFLSGEEPERVTTLAENKTPSSSADLEKAKNQIRQEVEASIRQDLEKTLQAIGRTGNAASYSAGGPDQTMTVLPSTGSSTLDTSIKTQVKNSFSDEVSVQFDETGRSGVITPVFRSAPGSNYLFILTPVRK